MQLSGYKAFQAKRTVNAKALKWEVSVVIKEQAIAQLEQNEQRRTQQETRSEKNGQMVRSCVGQYDSHWPQMATGHLEMWARNVI